MRQYKDVIIMNIVRDITELIQQKIQPQKVILILGARRVGKTVLVNKLLKSVKEPVLKLNSEDISVHHKLALRSIENYKNILGGYNFFL
jgi:predicted AAA+ superfamily ATPase